ncbi:tRNA (guanine(9)-N(1))-methyltransferase Trmt10A [Chironomus tepperi]|uniref:tRNA (guanine(9)-N(1))-methyltransferase Trmt10A n=1 Tax=Chironomus tepperi TaxID=113505 RepID=UPI00391F2F7F
MDSKEEEVETINGAPEEQPLSKKQRKKLEKRQKFLEMKKNLREKERAKRKLKKIQLKEQGIKIEGPSRKQLKRNKADIESASFQIAIDLSFDEFMAEKDLSSLCSQLLRIYTANRRAKKPIPIHFTGLKEDTRMYQQLEKNEGWKHWDVMANDKSYSEIFDKDKIVYLTSESENVLDKFEDGHCYVIGGIVDHNSQKGLTLDLAEKQGIKTARLPLSEYVSITSRSVLTVNQCFEILLGVSEGKSWKEILMEVLPQRKMPKLKTQVSDES